MNIAIISNEFPPPIESGGISQALYSLYNAYSKNYGTVFVFNTLISDFKKNFIKSLTIKKKDVRFTYRKIFKTFLRIIKNGNIFHYFKFLFKYFNFFIKSPYDNWKKSIIWPSQFTLIFESVENTLEYFKQNDFHIIFAGKLGFESIISYILKLITKKKFVVFTHGNDFLFNNAWRKLILYHSDGIIMGTKKMKKLINLIYPKITAPFYIIPFGITIKNYEISKSKLQLRKELKIEPNEFVILSVGRHVYRKGFDFVIKALKNIKDKESNFNFKYYLIGEGPETNNLKSLIKEYDLEKEILFLGFLDEIMRNKYYKSADIFAMTSRKIDPTDIEGFGIVYLEANFFRLPVIAANTGGVPEAVDLKSGFLIEPENIKELEEKITLVYKNKELKEKMSENAHKRIINNYSWDKIVLKYYKAFKMILNS